MRFAVDPWDPAYGGVAESSGTAETTATLNLATEREPGSWTPIAVAKSLRQPVLFVDGVRRVEARLWIEGEADGIGLCASWAAGVVRCEADAEVVAAEVERGVFAASPNIEPVDTAVGVFSARVTPSSAAEVLSLALQERLTRLEVEVAEHARQGSDALLVVDGPLRGRQHLAHAVGMIKTQHVRYLPETLDPILERLAPGQRTPVFTIGTSWSRHSWYVRLPGSPSARAGIVRCECSADLSSSEAVAMASATAALLPRFASAPHKDPRAPQNLTPIAGLERRLRHLLGDALLVRRALQRAAALTTAVTAV